MMASPRPMIFRVLLAAAAVGVIAACLAGLFWWTRGSPYRGRLVPQAVVVTLERDGESKSLGALEVHDLRAGDVVRTSLGGSAKLGWSNGAESFLSGDGKIRVGEAKGELEFLGGRIIVTAKPGAPITVIWKGRVHSLVGQEIEISPAGVQATFRVAEMTRPGGKTIQLEPGLIIPWD